MRADVWPSAERVSKLFVTGIMAGAPGRKGHAPDLLENAHGNVTCPGKEPGVGQAAFYRSILRGYWPDQASTSAYCGCSLAMMSFRYGGIRRRAAAVYDDGGPVRGGSRPEMPAFIFYRQGGPAVQHGAMDHGFHLAAMISGTGEYNVTCSGIVFLMQ